MKLRTAVAALALLVGAGASASAADPAAVTAGSERVNFNIGCLQSGEDPRCETTAYWLGTGVGTNNVGSTLDATPAGYALYQADGAYTTTSFAGDETLRPSYTLIGGSVITGQVALSGFVAGGEVGVDSAVYVALNAARLDGPKPKTVALGEAEVTKVVSTPIDTVYEFEMTVPAALDGVPVGRLSAEVGQRHVTVLQNGFMDGTGGSFFDLPFAVPAEPETSPAG